MKKIIYVIAVSATDGTEFIGFGCPADLTNFIMDIQDNVLGMALTVLEE